LSIILLVRGAIPDSRRHRAGLVRGATLDSGRRELAGAQGRDEEIANSITHCLGLALSIAGLAPLLSLAGNIGTTRYALGCGVYGASLVSLYAASTLFHSWPAGAVKRVFLLLDHVGIYVLIAGTYTPVAMVASHGIFASSSLTAAWGFALIGSFAKVVRVRRLDGDSSIPYFVMSGMCLTTLLRLLANVPPDQNEWLIGGGLFYVAGLFFFFNDQRLFYHSIWHVFVLAGSICHYRAVIGYVIAASF
jgi:hemolysin III